MKAGIGRQRLKLADEGFGQQIETGHNWSTHQSIWSAGEIVTAVLLAGEGSC
jgi:hypothetical protein